MAKQSPAAYYLKFPDWAVFIAALPESWAPRGRVIKKTDEYVIDDFGRIEGSIGFHVNLLMLDGDDLPEELEEYRIPEPQFPVRTWAEAGYAS